MIIPMFSGIPRVGATELVGSVTKAVANVGSWDSSGEALDVLSVASVGDLAVIAFTIDTDGDSTWSFAGMSFTDISKDTSTGMFTGGHYVGYRIIEAGDANPYITGVSSSDWFGLSVVCAVFRGASFVDAATSSESSGDINPPSLTADGGLWLAVGHREKQESPSWDAPVGYELASTASYQHPSFGIACSTAIAFKAENLSSDNPGAFTDEGGSFYWTAHTIAFSG